MTMQPEELKAIRTTLGLTQAQLGAALGLTGQFVGFMERGGAPIEPRTTFSMLYIAEHPDAVGELISDVDTYDGTAIAQVRSLLEQLPRSGPGSYETSTLSTSGAGPIILTIRFRR